MEDEGREEGVEDGGRGMSEGWRERGMRGG